MSEQTPYDVVYLLGKQAERERMVDAIKELSTWNEEMTQRIIYVVDLEEVLNGN